MLVNLITSLILIMLKSIKIGRGTDNEVPEWKIRARWSSFMFITVSKEYSTLTRWTLRTIHPGKH